MIPEELDMHHIVGEVQVPYEPLEVFNENRCSPPPLGIRFVSCPQSFDFFKGFFIALKIKREH